MSQPEMIAKFENLVERLEKLHKAGAIPKLGADQPEVASAQAAPA